MYDLKNELKLLQDNYLTENSESNEKEEICTLKPNVKSLEVEDKFLRNDVVSKENLMILYWNITQTYVTVNVVE